MNIDTVNGLIDSVLLFFLFPKADTVHAAINVFYLLADSIGDVPIIKGVNHSSLILR